MQNEPSWNFFYEIFFYKDSEIEVKKSLLKQVELSQVQNSYPDPLQFRTYLRRNRGFFTSPKPSLKHVF